MAVARVGSNEAVMGSVWPPPTVPAVGVTPKTLDAARVTLVDRFPVLFTVRGLVTGVFGAVVGKAILPLLKASTAPRAVMLRLTSVTVFRPVVTCKVSP